MLRDQPLPAVLLSALLLLGPHRSSLPGPVGALGTKQLLKPSAKHVKLQVVTEGLDYLNAITDPVVPVFVLGKYRTGKSFLLNQLANLSCSTGFGVGHNRAAETSGVWIHRAGDALFVDTEGLSAPGALRAYDDRLTAFATLNAEVLIYNLREAVEEADLERLSFGLELSEHLSAGAAYEAPVLVWTVQQDFLGGDSLERALELALRPVENPESVAHTAAINLVRQRLRRVNQTRAVGLPQPHARRAALCELDASELDENYVSRRDELAAVVAAAVAGAPKLPGAEVARQVLKTVEALNRGVFPSSFEVVNYFNQDAALKCLRSYEDAMGALLMRIPVANAELEAAHKQQLRAAREMFERLRFGRDARTVFLDRAVHRSYVGFSQTNANALLTACTVLEDRCLEALNGFRTPSLHWYEATAAKCEKRYGQLCSHSLSWLSHVVKASRERFVESYNDRVLNCVALFCFAGALASRWLFSVLALELACWAALCGLLASSKLLFLYDSAAWRYTTRAWEALFDWWALGLLSLLAWRFRGVARRKLA
jgi:hypothetical protein